MNSWKEIAAYLGRNVRTAMRWELTRSLPVHRLPGGRKAAVYALRSEIEGWRSSSGTYRRAENAPVHSTDCTLAILPFDNLSADKDNEYFCDGLVDLIITALAAVPSLRIAARTSSFAFRGKVRDVREIGAKLGVGLLLEGSVQRIGSRIRVSAQLVSCSDGCHVWCNRYDRDGRDGFLVQEELADAIASSITAKIAP